MDPTTIYFLDVGLGSNLKDIKLAGQSGRIVQIVGDRNPTTILGGLKCPDGIDISPSAGRMFWTNMGLNTSTRDGSVMSAKLDGSDVQVLIPEGAVHTPKQLIVDDVNKKLYFCDREGLGVHRCGFDGQDHEVLVLCGITAVKSDLTRWCVGIAVDLKGGKFYWTQKGASKANQGRIFCANVDMPPGGNASNRSDIETLFENLPEPIDLELDAEAQMLYWTDRGEHPYGNTLNRACVADANPQVQILARHFHEPIGLKIDALKRHIYVTDLGGSLYRFDMDGSNKTVLHNDDGCYTGITLA